MAAIYAAKVKYGDAHTAPHPQHGSTEHEPSQLQLKRQRIFLNQEMNVVIVMKHYPCNVLSNKLHRVVAVLQERQSGVVAQYSCVCRRQMDRNRFFYLAQVLHTSHACHAERRGGQLE